MDLHSFFALDPADFLDGIWIQLLFKCGSGSFLKILINNYLMKSSVEKYKRLLNSKKTNNGACANVFKSFE